MKRVTFLLVWIGMLFAPHTLPAFMPTDDQLRITESTNFIYIYQSALEDQIPGLIGDCEDAYTLLTPIFQWTPRKKVIVLFSDGYDIHNGWATVFPRPIMMIYTADTPPGAIIYEPGNYIRRTVFHEFTHLLSMDPQSGLDGALSGIFGRVLPGAGDPLSILITLFAMPPGAVAPTWFIEGLALWTETEMVGPGRGRNTLVDMIFRVATKEDRLLPPTQWDLKTPDWPFGTAAYIYGMKMIQYAHETYGLGEEERNIAGELSRSATKTFPFIFSGRAYPVTGQTFSELAWESLEYERSRQKKRIQYLSSRPFTEMKRLTPTNLQVYHPRFDRNAEKILFSGAPEEQRDTLYQYDTRKTDSPLSRLDQIRTSGSFSRLAPSPDFTFYYYTRLDSPRREKLVSQLYRYDANRSQTHRVTKTGRYRFPTISPDHKNLAAVRAEAGHQILLEVPLAKAGDRAHEKIIVNAPPNTTIIDPAYAPDHRTIVYISANEISSQVRRFCLESNEDSILVEWPAIIASPVFHPEGHELVFVSDRNGVYNLYRMPYHADARPVAITHAFGGVFQPDFSPDGRQLVVSAYDADGYYLSILDYDALHSGIEEVPELETPWTPLAMNETQRKAIEYQKNIKNVSDVPDTQKYRPYRALRPDYWSPWLDASPDGVQGGVFLMLSDPIERHRLTIKGGYESEHKTPLTSVVYDYSHFEPILSLYGFHDQTRYNNLLVDMNDVFYDYDEEIGGLGALLTVPFERMDRSVYLSLGYQWTRSRSIRATVEKFADAELRPTPPLYTGEEAAVWINLTSLSGTAFRRSHSVEDGQLLSLGVERTDEALAGDLNRTRILGSWNQYLALSWNNNHVLKLEGNYGNSHGDKTTQGAFGLGGFSNTIVASTPGMPRSLSLRGYNENTQVGTEIVKVGVAYRFPIVRFYRGINATSPIYMHQLSGEIFYEGGRVTGSPIARRDGNDWINAHGTEINLGLTLLRWIDIAPGIGLVYAFDRSPRGNADRDENINEKWQIYITLKSIINF